MESSLRLETPRLLLRHLRMEDAPRVQELASDRQIAATTLAIPHPYPENGAETFIRSLLEPVGPAREEVCAITLKGSGELIGLIGLHFVRDHDRAEMGYWIGVPFWHQGYCSEAASAMLEHGFLTLGLHRIYAHYFSINPASGRVMEKIGLRYEGTLPQHVKKWGQFVDTICYGLLRDQWLSARP